MFETIRMPKHNHSLKWDRHRRVRFLIAPLSPGKRDAAALYLMQHPDKIHELMDRRMARLLKRDYRQKKQQDNNDKGVHEEPL